MSKFTLDNTFVDLILIFYYYLKKKKKRLSLLELIYLSYSDLSWPIALFCMDGSTASQAEPWHPSPPPAGPPRAHPPTVRGPQGRPDRGDSREVHGSTPVLGPRLLIVEAHQLHAKTGSVSNSLLIN